MTAILKGIRELDARFKRGELTSTQYAARRKALLQSVKVIETEFEPISSPVKPPGNRHPKRPENSTELGFSIVVCLGVMGFLIALILILLHDLNLALTLGATLIAALSVALFRALDD